MKGSSVYAAILLACIILHGNADDSEEGQGTDESSEEEFPVQDRNCPRYCQQNPSRGLTVCGSNDQTYRSPCLFQQHACAVGATGYWYIAHMGACMRRQPVTPKRVPTTRRRPITARVTRAPTTTRKTTTKRTTTTTTTTAAPVVTTPIPCPPTCELVLEPVCTTVGTYQNECTFNWVRCQGIISPTESILYMGYCLDTSTAGP